MEFYENHTLIHVGMEDYINVKLRYMINAIKCIEIISDVRYVYQNCAENLSYAQME